MKSPGNGDNEYSFYEEIANVTIHSIGLLSGIAGLVLLLTCDSCGRDALSITGISVFGATVIILYSSSILYHSVNIPRFRAFFRRMDHSAIYLLIAGSYTVFTLSPALRGPWGWSLFGVVWGLAAIGIALEIGLGNRANAISMVLYLLMGWLIVISLPSMIGSFTYKALVWLFAGGIFYTSGIIFYAARRMPFNHAVWHLFVLGGSVSHFIAAYYCLSITLP